MSHDDFTTEQEERTTMVDLKVDDGVLHTLASDLQKSAGDIDSTLSAMQGDMTSLRGEWTGTASDSASGWHQTWEANMRTQLGYLKELVRIISEIDDMYTKADQDAASFWPF